MRGGANRRGFWQAGVSTGLNGVSSKEQRARQFGNSPAALHPLRQLYAAWLLCSTGGGVGRRIMRLAFAHICPHPIPMRGATAMITNAKATAFRIVRSPSVTLGGLVGPSRVGKDQDDMWARTRQFLPGTIGTMDGVDTYRHPTYRLLRERPRYHDGTLVVDGSRRSSRYSHAEQPCADRISTPSTASQIIA